MAELASFDGRFRADDITIGVADDSMVPTLRRPWPMPESPVSGRSECTLRNRVRFDLLSAVALHVASARDELPPDFATLADLSAIRMCTTGSGTSQPESLHDDDAFTRRHAWLNELDQYLAEHLQITPGVLLGNAPRRFIVAEVCRAVEFLLRCLIPDTKEAENARSAVVARLLPFKERNDIDNEPSTIWKTLHRSVTHAVSWKKNDLCPTGPTELSEFWPRSIVIANSAVIPKPIAALSPV